MAVDVEKLVEGWINHFWAADHALIWTQAEQELWMPLIPGVILAGRVDAFGLNGDNERFFGEWKTNNPTRKNTWKAIWRMNPQSLTYGVLSRNVYPDCHKFHVRQAFKSNPATYDSEWYSYSDAELDHWLEQCKRIAHEIQSQSQYGPWLTNFKNCFYYGPKYACPHFENGCDKQKWRNKEGLIVREPHLAVEQNLRATGDTETLVLDATAITVYLTCPEKFRKEYVEGVRGDITDAIEVGAEMHDYLDRYYSGLVGGNAI